MIIDFVASELSDVNCICQDCCPDSVFHLTSPLPPPLHLTSPLPPLHLTLPHPFTLTHWILDGHPTLPCLVLK